jgi:hypothetical protein
MLTCVKCSVVSLLVLLISACCFRVASTGLTQVSVGTMSIDVDWTHCRNYTEITGVLLEINRTYPDIVDVFSARLPAGGLPQIPSYAPSALTGLMHQTRSPDYSVSGQIEKQ